MNNGTYIERIDITSFGKLKNVTLTPSKGLSLLAAPNEAGKSTVASFIKFIFYGFGGQRKQTVSENEKLLYMPWGGTRAAGGITVVTPDGRFRVERAQSATKETLDVFDVFTRKSVFTGMVPGEVFFGIGEESFLKILFFRQLYLPKNGDEALAEQIQNLIFSADEKTNAERAVKRLKEARSALKNNQKRGLIPELESELEAYEEKLTSSLETKRALDSVLASLGEKKQKIAFNEAKLAALEKEAENIKKYGAKKRLDGLVALAKLKQEADAKYDDCMRGFEGETAPETAFVQELINDNAFFTVLEKRIDETAKEIKDEMKRHEMAKESTPFFVNDPEKIEKRLKFKRIITLLFFFGGAASLFLAGAALFTSGLDTVFYAVSAVSAALFAITAVVAFKTPASVKKLGFKNKTELVKAIEAFPVIKLRAEDKAKQIQAMEKAYSEDAEKYNALRRSIDNRIRRYMSGEESTYGLAIQKMLNLSMEAGALKADCMALGDRLESALAEVDIEELKRTAEGAVPPAREAAAVGRETDFYKSANEALKKQELELERQRAALEVKSPSPAVVYGKREAVKNRLAEYRVKYEALETALAVLEEAGDYMKSTVSPKLAQLASAYFTAATDGKDPEMHLTTDLLMSVPTSDGDKSADYLSGGAKDTAYLCLRYALIELLYERKRPFIILDDAFSRIDDDRLKLMLQSLARLSEEQQIIIFTCHAREGKFLKEITDKFEVLSI